MKGIIGFGRGMMERAFRSKGSVAISDLVFPAVDFCLESFR